MAQISGTVVNSYNIGNITCTSTANSTSCGGIIGQALGNIANCYNLGNITATQTRGVGGVVASLGIYGDNDNNNILLNISNCYNLGTVSANSLVAGITPYIYSAYPGLQVQLNNCYNIDEEYFDFFDTTMPTNLTTNNIGLINADGTFSDSTPYADLLTALNAWVNENKTTYPELRNWKMGTNNFPTFVD